MMLVVLCGLQSAINIGMILRSAEVYANPVVIVDTFRVLENSTHVQTISDFACGALQRTPPQVVEDYSTIDLHNGRLITTTPIGPSRPMARFDWRDDDALLIGNEYSGVPPLIAEKADVRVRIAMPAVFAPKAPSQSPIDPRRVSQIANASEPALNVAIAASAMMIDAFGKSAPTVRAADA